MNEIKECSGISLEKTIICPIEDKPKEKKECSKCGWDWYQEGLVNCKTCQKVICDRDSCIDDEGICLDCHESNCIEKNELRNKKPIVKIQGTLTKRIELRENYYYSFVKLKDNLVELPVIFKEKPNLAPYSQLELTGYYSNSETNIRKSFTCLTYQILSLPTPETIPKLQEQIQTLLVTSAQKAQEWTQRKDFLTKKLAEVKELENLSKLEPKYLEAYLLVKDAHYTNFQANLPFPNFTLAEYLKRIAQELAIASQKIQAYQRKSCEGIQNSKHE